MADESEGIDIKLSEEDSPAEILRESEDISLFAEDHGIGEASIETDLKLDDDLSDSEEDNLKLGMDEIGDLVDEIKLDDQEEEKADATSDGEEDMVFEESESQIDGLSELEDTLDELGEEEGSKKSTEDVSPELEGSKDSQEDTDVAESDKDNEEVDTESDHSKNLDVSEEPENSPELDAVADSEISEEPESDVTDNDELMKEESGSSDVMDMLHDPNVDEESDEIEPAESENLDLSMEELDDTVEETSNIELEESESAPSLESEDSEIDDLEDLSESESEEANELSEESSGGLEDVSEEIFPAESEDQDESKIENAVNVRPQEQDTSAVAADSLGSKMLLSLHHEAVVEVARTKLTGEEITQITYGSIIELDKTAGEPVDLVIEGKTIARGEIVQINNDKLGIRIVGIVQD